MERLTFVCEYGTILFDNPAGFPEDIGFTIRELAENEEWETLDKIAERLANTEQRLQLYEELEAQGLLLKLPCKVGNTVYVVPSKVNYDLNVLNKHYEDNRVYEQVVNEIRIYRSGIFIVTCDGQAGVRDESYKETWFFTKEEAEAKLKEMEGK